MKKKYGIGAAASAVSLLLFLSLPPLAGATEPDFKVPDTGITECYDADGNQLIPCPGPGQTYYGQDGNVLHNVMSFTDNEDGTLTDNVTGLLWQQTDDGTYRNWDASATYCAGLDLGGHSSGWRLPELVELHSILDLSVDSGAAVDSLFTGTAAEGYWSSTEDPDNSGNAWSLDFGTTEDGSILKTSTLRNRCVWGVQ